MIHLVSVDHLVGDEPYFQIRGTLPWHNFLSGPTAWDLKDYQSYLDEMEAHGMNFIGFHNYTGGGERYADYVEPMIRISYKNIVPDAYFDNSMTARWGYTPMKIKDFAFNTWELFSEYNPEGPFGAECSINALTSEEHYQKAQQLMKQVIREAHKRNIQVAMGFEFGVHPPEYHSLKPDPGFYWTGEANLIPNPTHYQSIKILYATIDNILETYPDLDYIWLWLNEHSFFGVNIDQALSNEAFRKVFDREAHHFGQAAGKRSAQFIGVWSLYCLRLAKEYIDFKKPGLRVILGGWGGGNQLPMIMQGLDRALPKDIIFSLLNPGLGTAPPPEFLGEIAENRVVFSIPWLEGDHCLWHLQSRVNLMRDHVKRAHAMKLDGVIAIHWRTEETRLNFTSFAHFAKDPEHQATVTEIYQSHLEENYGAHAAEALRDILVTIDKEQWDQGVSQEYYAYNPDWGRMSEPDVIKVRKLLAKMDSVIAKTKGKRYVDNLEWLKANYAFALLLNDVGRGMEPAYDLMGEFYATGLLDRSKLDAAISRLEQAPLQELFRVYASRVRSKGEMGVLSSLNQKLWVQYRELKIFMENCKNNTHQ